MIKAGGTFNDDFIESDIEFTMQHVARFEMTPHRYFCAWRQYVAGLRYFIFDDRLYLAEKLLR
ncbi:hypothetical protein [Bosea psychrotolerans]|uniref:hypothetical protein n=1 Tax=Bosea psychrotolerans TaxID=1871628 RepID=UPI0011B0C1C7|nr:hypothetical protein [Bosea psychrotolerans]